MTDSKQLWSGHVSVWIDEDGKKLIRYCADGENTGKTYEPSGYFEKKAVNGLIQSLTQ